MVQISDSINNIVAVSQQLQDGIVEITTAITTLHINPVILPVECHI